MTLTQQYTRALLNDDLEELVRIEKEHDLFGFSPNVVTVGLHAIDNGLDGISAIADYLEAPQ